MILKNKKAFSLIEISIVLVIVGLIVAGVVGSKHLIENYKTAFAVTNMSKFNSLVSSYRSKYKSLPGDGGDIETRFRTAVDDPAVDKNENELHNGNADGFIGTNNSDNPALEQESLSFFQGLYLADILDRPFTGQIPTTDSDPDITLINKNGKQHYPTTKLGDNTFLYLRTDDFGRKFRKQTRMAIGVSSNSTGAVSPRIAEKIDKKIDDGNPLTGVIITVDYDTSQAKCLTCGGEATSLDAIASYEDMTTAVYNTDTDTEDDPACTVMKNLEDKATEITAPISGEITPGTSQCSLPSNLHRTWSPSTSPANHGATVTGTCSTGYSGADPVTMTCINGEWNESATTCYADCEELSTSTYHVASFSSSAVTHTTNVTGNCATGYTGGVVDMSCTDGTWSTPSNPCYAKCTLPTDLHVNAATWSPSTDPANHEATSTGTCAAGYSGGAVEITCTDGSWSTPNSLCYADCEELSTSTYHVASFSSSAVTHTTNVTGSCATGYTGGDVDMTCSDGSWSTPSSLCTAICPADDAALNVATWPACSDGECNEDEVIQATGCATTESISISAGYPTATCQSDRSWSVSSMSGKCQDCSISGAISAGSTVLTSFASANIDEISGYDSYGEDAEEVKWYKYDSINSNQILNSVKAQGLCKTDYMIRDTNANANTIYPTCTDGIFTRYDYNCNVDACFQACDVNDITSQAAYNTATISNMPGNTCESAGYETTDNSNDYKLAQGNSTYNLTCASGYGSSSIATVTCGASGTWSAIANPCYESCSNPSYTDVTVYVTSWTSTTAIHGNSVTSDDYTAGYYSAGLITATCNDGSWEYSGSVSEVYCTAITTATSGTGWATWLGTHLADDTTQRSGTCTTNYVGSPIRICTDDGDGTATWGTISNACTLADNCGSYPTIGSPYNITSWSGGTNHTNVITASTCATGYEGGPVQLTCYDGSWGSQSGVCAIPTGYQAFSYTGNYQPFEVPENVISVTMQVWGAQGGSYLDYGDGGKGGYAKGTKSVTPGAYLYVYVGEQGQSWPGGEATCYSTTFNGGGGGRPVSGGGGTDIRISSGSWDDTSIWSRVIVAGGGGGGGSNCEGGYGGGGSGNYNYAMTQYIGTGGESNRGGYNGAYRGPQSPASEDGNIGKGGYGGIDSDYPCDETIRGILDGIPGGGGYYGGGASTSYLTSGGGGSNYTDGLSSTTSSAGVRSGNGFARICWGGHSQCN